MTSAYRPTCYLFHTQSIMFFHPEKFFGIYDCSLCSTLYSTFVDKYIRYSFQNLYLMPRNMLRRIRCEGCGISPAFSGCLAHREVKWTDQSADLFLYLPDFFGGVWLSGVECSS
jgi:hypothetical protein